MREIRDIVTDNFAGYQLKDFLKKKLSFSSSLITRVKFGGLFVNGENVTTRKILCTGDTVSVIFPTEESKNIEPVDMPLKVLYEDDYIIAVDKPVNMPTHPSKYNSLITLASLVSAYMKRPFVFRAITRLDRDTSGIVLIAKDALTAKILSQDMKERRITKKYCAILSRAPDKQSGIINAPIERADSDGIKREIREDGKEAITEYRLLKVFEDGRALCEFKPITGRTHQIRVHAAHIGTPLYNDFLYGNKVSDGTYFLRCTSLSFDHPTTKQHITINAEPL